MNIRAEHLTGHELNREYRRQGCVRHFQPYMEDSSGEVVQPLVVVLQTPFQQRMLDQFGRRIAFLDATFGTNKYGYPLYTLLVSAHRRWAGLRVVVPCLPPGGN